MSAPRVRIGRGGRARGASVLTLAAVLAIVGCGQNGTQDQTQVAAGVGLTDSGGPRATAGSCDGFKNGPGITDSEITISTVADVSGFQPGLFKSVQDAVKAYVAYFNAAQNICGRKLKFEALDSRLDAGAEQQAVAQSCGEAFAMIGSMSAFDDSGAATAEKCGIPDLRTAAITARRSRARTTYATVPTRAGLVLAAVPDYFVKNYHDATQHAGFLYLSAGAAALNAKYWIKAYEKAGFHFDYVQAVDALDTNYTPYVLALKKKKVKYVQILGTYGADARLATAMKSQQYKPDLYVVDSAGYDSRYAPLAGPGGEGTYTFNNQAFLEEASSNEELRRYIGWLQKTTPYSQPTYFGMAAWAAARLFTDEAIGLGGRLDRQTLLAAVRQVHDYTGNGMLSPADVGGRKTPNCQSFAQLVNGKWVRKFPAEVGKYVCGPLIDVG